MFSWPHTCISIHCLFNWLIVAVYGDHIWVNIGSSNGLLSDGIKPLPEPILTSQCVLLHVPQSKFAVSGQATCAQRCIMSLQITLLWSLPYMPISPRDRWVNAKGSTDKLKQSWFKSDTSYCQFYVCCRAQRLPEPMLTPTELCHMTSVGHNELNIF